MAQATHHVLVSFSPRSLLGSQNNAYFVLCFFLSIGYSNVKQKLFHPEQVTSATECMDPFISGCGT